MSNLRFLFVNFNKCVKEVKSLILPQALCAGPTLCHVGQRRQHDGLAWRTTDPCDSCKNTTLWI